jgi:hypothetical protein
MRVGEALSRLVGQPVHFDELAAADAAVAAHTAAATAAAAAAVDGAQAVSSTSTTTATKQRKRRRKPRAQQQQQLQSHLLDDIDPDAVLDLSVPTTVLEDSSAEQSAEQSSGEDSAATSEAESEVLESSSKGLLQPYVLPDEGVLEGAEEDRVEGNMRDGRVPLYLHQAIESECLCTVMCSSRVC